jgi:sugar phosphate isomerase/epimerase
MSLGIFGKVYVRAGVDEVIAAVAADRLSAVQFNMASAGLPTLPDEVPDTAVEVLCQALARYQVTPAALSGTYNLIDPDPARRSANRHRLIRLIGAAPAMGFHLVTLCTGTRDPDDMWRAHPDNSTEGAWMEMRAELDVLAGAAEASGVMLGIEPEFGNVVATPGHAARLLKEAGTASLGVVIDPANLEEHPRRESLREALARAVEAVGPHIRLAHAKDRTTAGNEAPAGRGEVDFPHFFMLLDAAGYTGPVVMHGLAEWDVGSAVAHLSGSAAAAGIGLTEARPAVPAAGSPPSALVMQ